MDRPDPPYRVIADSLRDQISSGELAPGARLPSMAALAEHHGVSPRTAQKALQQLRGEGLVHITQKGATVRTAPRALPLAPERTGTLDVPDRDHIAVTGAGVVPMLPSVGAALGVNADGLNRTVVRRESITRREGVPYRLAVSWTHPSFTAAAPELLQGTPIPNLLAVIATRCGRRADHGRDYWESRTCDRREAGALEVPVGSAVLAGASVYSDSTGPILYYEWVAPPHRAVTMDYSLSVP
ncbi:GntR family transcriptional regulator [Streptomonospora sp. S1-112]|uniref:GntR family transcriptional regulator n=1 Tax=Streptomonospora mangrovi TaxID=2883123 RepID=A0A9X3NIW3_9ACTN|nr:GntR family transcriptional regulator [Streptomonospora mangrovi]